MEKRLEHVAVEGARWRAFKHGLQTVHLWLGLILAIPIIVIGVSGSALLVQREILANSIPAATASGPSQPLTRIIGAATSAAPQDATPRSIVLPNGFRMPATVQFDFAGRPPRSLVYVDPASLNVLGTSEVVQRGPVLAFLINTHAFLMMPTHIGLPFVGWMAVAMSFMAISGLILWWPRAGTWRRAFLMRRGARGLRFHIEFHHVVGFWGSAILLIMGVSGIYLTFPETFRVGVEALFPTGLGSEDGSANFQPGVAPLDADRAMVAALSAVPNTQVVNVQLPPNLNLPFVVQLETLEFRPRAPAILVTLDGQTGKINFVDDPRRYSLGDKVQNLQHALHFGLGMGWLWKLLVFISGVLPLGLAITGLNMWWKRRARNRLPEAIVNVPAE